MPDDRQPGFPRRVDARQVLWPSLVLSMTVLSLNQVGDFFQKRAAVRDAAL